MGYSKGDRLAGREPPPIPNSMTDDMKVADLVEVLESLRFGHQQFRTIQINRGVRNFLIRAIKPPR